MDSGWAAIAGAGIGAFASLAASFLGMIPWASPELRADRLRRRQEREELVIKISADLVRLAVDQGTDLSKTEDINLRSELLVTRVRLANLVPKRDKVLMPLFDLALAAAQTEDHDLRAMAATYFSGGSARWLRTRKLDSDAAEFEAKLRAALEAASARPGGSQQ